MRLFLLSLLTVFYCAGIAAPVAAKNPPKEDQWAQCLWKTVPQSTANWLAMPNSESASSSNEKTPRELLEYRLQAACFGKLTPEGKKFPIGFAPSKVRSALAASKPAVIEPDLIDPKAYQCARYFLNDRDMKNPAAFKWGFGDFDTGHAFASVTYVFAAKGGGGVGLPDIGGLHKCQWINSDGILTDA